MATIGHSVVHPTSFVISFYFMTQTEPVPETSFTLWFESVSNRERKFSHHKMRISRTV